MSVPPCHDPEFREQIREVHSFIWRILSSLVKTGLLSDDYKKKVILTIKTMKRCESYMLGISKE